MPETFVINEKGIIVFAYVGPITNKIYETEASGGVTLKNVRKIASTGVNRISVGQITHSAPSANFKLQI